MGKRAREATAVTVCFGALTPILEEKSWPSPWSALPASSIRPALLREGCGCTPVLLTHHHLQVDIRITSPTQAQVSGVHSLSALLAGVPGAEASCMSVVCRFPLA